MTMNRSVRLLLRVLAPLVGLPHGVTGCRPPEVRPRRRRAGGRSGSSRPRGCGAAAPASACGPPSERDVLVVDVADLPHGGRAVDVHLPHLARGELDLRVLALLRHELRGGAGAPHELASLALPELEVVDHGAGGDHLEGERVAGEDVRSLPRHHGLAHLHAVGSEDVALVAVPVVQERDPRGAVGVVLQGRHPRRDVPLVPPEVDHAVVPLVPAAAEPDGDAALAVPAPGLLEGLGERPLRPLLGEAVEVERRHEAAPGGRWVVLLECHRLSPPTAARRTRPSSRPSSGRRRPSSSPGGGRRAGPAA